MATLWARVKACFSNGVGPSVVVPIAIISVDGTIHDTCRVNPWDSECIPELVEAFGTVASRQKYAHLSAAAYLAVSPSLIRVRCDRTGTVFSVSVAEDSLELVSPHRSVPVYDHCTVLHGGSSAMFYM